MTKKAIDGKSLIKELDECKTGRDVIATLGRYVKPEDINERLANVSDNPLVVTLQNQATRYRIENNGDYETRNQDCVNMAAERYCKLTGKALKEVMAKNKDALTMSTNLHAQRA